jgi:hypothetical protein
MPPSRGRYHTRRKARPTKFDGLGEGRSISIYTRPTVTDTCVLLAFFNPVPFRRILKNMLYIIKILKEKEIPYFVAECVFHGRKPQIPGADLVLKSNSYMFYKEQLLNKLEGIIPAQYTKLVCMDGDIMFDAPDWINQISVKLDTCDIIQPFSDACWLTPDNTRIRMKKPSYAYALANNIRLDAHTVHKYHPGFVWAFRREVFRAIGGFYDRGIMGNGDMLFAFNLFRDSIPDFWKRDVLKTEFILDEWEAYNAGVQKADPRIGYLNMKALHLFHGLREKRQYTTRYKDASEYMASSWNESIKLNTDGLYEFKDPRASEAVLAYFKGRDEDIPLKEAEAFLARKTVKATATVTPGGVNLNGAAGGPELNVPHA